MYHGYTFRLKLPPSYDEISKCSLNWDSAENIYNCMHGVRHVACTKCAWYRTVRNIKTYTFH